MCRVIIGSLLSQCARNCKSETNHMTPRPPLRYYATLGLNKYIKYSIDFYYYNIYKYKNIIIIVILKQTYVSTLPCLKYYRSPEHFLMTQLQPFRPSYWHPTIRPPYSAPATQNHISGDIHNSRQFLCAVASLLPNIRNQAHNNQLKILDLMSGENGQIGHALHQYYPQACIIMADQALQTGSISTNSGALWNLHLSIQENAIHENQPSANSLDLIISVAPRTTMIQPNGSQSLQIAYLQNMYSWLKENGSTIVALPFNTIVQPNSCRENPDQVAKLLAQHTDEQQKSLPYDDFLASHNVPQISRLACQQFINAATAAGFICDFPNNLDKPRLYNLGIAELIRLVKNPPPTPNLFDLPQTHTQTT